MTILFVILIVIASVGLSLIVLVQNPKGGGLAGNIAGFSSQFMGVKQTNDVLEKGTWIFSAIIGVLCLASTFFISGKGTAGSGGRMNEVGGAGSVPAQTAPASNIPQQQPVTPTP